MTQVVFLQQIFILWLLIAIIALWDKLQSPKRTWVSRVVTQKLHHQSFSYSEFDGRTPGYFLSWNYDSVICRGKSNRAV